jgi:hypothetical protein
MNYPIDYSSIKTECPGKNSNERFARALKQKLQNIAELEELTKWRGTELPQTRNSMCYKSIFLKLIS